MKQLILSFTSLFYIVNSFGQGISFNTTGNPPDPSAIVDMSSTQAGLLIPRMSESQRDAIANPAVGLQVFNTTTNCFNMWNGTTWKQSCYECTFILPTVSYNGPVCAGDSIFLQASNLVGATYQWSGPNGFNSTLQNPRIGNTSVSNSGTYTLIVTKDGCTSSPIALNVTVNSIPATPVLSSNSPICAGQTLNLSAVSIPGATINWVGPSGFSSTNFTPSLTGSVSNSGTYTAVATINGCNSLQGSTNVTVNALPTVSFTPTSLTVGTNQIFTASGASTYAWVLNSGSPSVGSGTNVTSSWSTVGTYTVQVTGTDANGCVGVISQSVSVNPPPKNCLAVLTANPSAPSGVYVIDPDGVGGISPTSCYCDMTKDGGGWTLVLRDNLDGQYQASQTGSFGTLSGLQSLTGSSAKYTDAFINACKTQTNSSIAFRTTNSALNLRYFHPGLCNYQHNSTNPSECMRYVATFTTSSSPAYLQCINWGGDGGGINCWYGCNGNGGYTNVTVSHRSSGYPQISGITTNTNGNSLGGSSNTYGNVFLMWVR